MIKIIERSSIITKAFELDYSNNPTLEKNYKKSGKNLKNKDDDDVNRNVNDLSKYPVVYLNNVMIESIHINKLILINEDFLPRLSISFIDPTTKLIDDDFPGDNSIISIFKASDNNSYMPIKMDFKVTDFTIIKGARTNENLTYEIEATLNVDDFYLMDWESFKDTSFNVLQKLSIDMGLGFASNINNTNDYMAWVNPGTYRIEFLREIIDNSYISDDTFLFGYIDFFYNFNYVDIEKQLTEDISEQKNLIDSSLIIKNGEEKETPLILTNHPDRDATNLKIDKYTLINSSTNTNLIYGYRHFVNFYNKNGDEIKNYALDSISDAGSNKIVLKGNDNEDGGNTLYNNMYNNTWMGKLDTDNVHENFLHSDLQNKLNLKFLQKLKIKIKLNQINYGLYRFQKVNVELYNMGKYDDKSKDKNKKNSKDKNNTKQEIDTFENNIINKLSGEWLITAINIIFDKIDGNKQEITLVKRELTEKYDFPGRT